MIHNKLRIFNQINLIKNNLFIHYNSTEDLPLITSFIILLIRIINSYQDLS
jgi:hypothetical protein